jgi:hypothetical protein
MGNKLMIALEKELEISKLLDAEEQAKKTGEFDLLHNKVLNDKKSEEASASSDEEPIADDTAEVDENTDSEVTTSDETTTEPEATTDVEDKPAQESFRELTYSNISLEDYGDYYSDSPSKFKQVMSKVGEGLLTAGKYIGYLGITYTPIVATHVYKGVVFIMGKLAKLLLNGIVDTTKYLNRRINSFNNLKENIATLRKTISEIKTKKEQVDLTNVKFTHKKTINALKISNSVDLIANIEILSSFLNNTIKKIDTSISNDVGSIKHLIAQTTSNVVKNPLNVMKPSIPTSGLTSGILKGYEPSDELVEAYQSNETLPGDVVLILHIPNSNINSLDDTIKAYNGSSIFLGINLANYQEIDSIDYMSADSLEKYLDELDKLCDICISHQSLYERVVKQKSGLRYNFKQYFNTLINSKSKVSIDNSLIEYVYLKSMFVDKVYLAAAMDIHDYSIKVINHSLSFVKNNIKKL